MDQVKSDITLRSGKVIEKPILNLVRKMMSQSLRVRKGLNLNIAKKSLKMMSSLLLLLLLLLLFLPPPFLFIIIIVIIIITTANGFKNGFFNNLTTAKSDV